MAENIQKTAKHYKFMHIAKNPPAGDLWKIEEMW
jgi:hypothetical protein